MRNWLKLKTTWNEDMSDCLQFGIQDINKFHPDVKFSLVISNEQSKVLIKDMIDAYRSEDENFEFKSNNYCIFCKFEKFSDKGKHYKSMYISIMEENGEKSRPIGSETWFYGSKGDSILDELLRAYYKCE